MLASIGVVLLVLSLAVGGWYGHKYLQDFQRRQEEERKQARRSERKRVREEEDKKKPSKVIVSGDVPSKVRRGRPSVVLLVEDSPTMLLTLRKILERWNYKVITASNGRKAWAELQKIRPDLVISDIEMPELNGIELVKLMRSDLMLMDVPVVLITASAAHYLKAGQVAEIDGLLQKPFEDKALIDQIRYILQE